MGEGPDTELQRLRRELHETKGDLAMARFQIAMLEGKLQGKPLYDHWTTAEAPRVTLDKDGKPIAWHITLNEYQRANLLWLMCDLIGYGIKGPGVEPFQAANTGDWNGEIPNMLRANHAEETEHRPNRTAEDLAKSVESWRNSGR